MKVKVFGSSGETVISRIDSTGTDLCKILKDLGFDIASASEAESYGAMLAFNHSSTGSAEADRLGVPRRRRILIAEEPPAVRPDQYARETFSRYGSVIASSRKLAGLFGDRDAGFLMLADMGDRVPLETLDTFRRRDNSAGFVQANKYSFVPGEQYTLRRRCLVKCQEMDIDVVVYGAGWNRGLKADWPQIRWALSNASAWTFPSLGAFRSLSPSIGNYRGIVEDKLTSLRDNRVALVIENDNRYASEKLLDAVGNAITVYIGTDVSQYGISRDAVVQVRPKVSLITETIRQLLSLSVESQHDLYVEQHRAALSQSTQIIEGVHQRIAREVHALLRSDVKGL